MTGGNMVNAQLCDAGEKGRGLKATRAISPGEVVFAEPSYAAVVFDSLASQVCHSCFRHQAKLHRCGQCRFAHYCDRTCQTACWDEHKRECGAIKKTGKAPNQNIRLAARVLWRIHKDKGLASDSQLVPVDQLDEHVQHLPEDQHKQLQADVHSLQKYWSYGSQQHSEDFISHIFGIIKCNGFTLSDQRGLQAVGMGLFPNLCLVNHDCWPNCTATLNHGKIELRALGKIADEEELTVSYVDFLHLSAERQKQLKEHFHFDCTCKHCSEHIGDDLMTAGAGGDGDKVCPDKVREVAAFSKECLEKIEKSRVDGDFTEVLKLCRECLEKQENVLADTHLSRLRVLSMAGEVLSFMHNFSEAADFARKMVDGYKKLYHPNHPLLGMAVMRAGVTHWHAGQIEVGHAMICKAYRILLVTHGSHHSVTIDLEKMRMQSEKELKMLKEHEDAENPKGFLRKE